MFHLVYKVLLLNSPYILRIWEKKLVYQKFIFWILKLISLYLEANDAIMLASYEICVNVFGSVEMTNLFLL